MKALKSLAAILWCAVMIVVRLFLWMVVIPVAAVITVVVLVFVGCVGYSAHNCYEQIKGIK